MFPTLGNFFALTCTQCMSPCSSCSVSTITCTSCVAGYTLNGSQCVSSFNFQISVSFSSNTNSTTFNVQLTQFISSIASAANVSPSQVIIISIIYGSIIVNAIISTTNAPGSSAAISQQNGLQNALNSGNVVGGLAVSTSTVSTNGGSNKNDDDDKGGISKTTVIILAVVIPVGTLCNCLLI